MPKDKASFNSLSKTWIENDKNLVFDGNGIFCRVCAKQVKCKKKFQVDQHLQTVSHMNNARKNSIQPMLNMKPKENANDTFSAELCEALVAANIPWRKLDNPIFNAFLNKYTNRKIPDESTLRKNYLDPLYLKVLQEIREDVGASFIWVSVDETTDTCGRYVANVVVGKLDSSHGGSPHLIMCRVLEKTNHATIARVVKDALRLLWPDEDHEEKFLAFLTDSAAYMLKAAVALQVFYPKMIHITCTVHGLHRAAEEIRSQHPKVNNLISSVKKVFVKAPSRTAIFKEELPGIPLPPEPVLTRWGTWLNAALYYCLHVEDVKKVLQILNPNDATCISSAVLAADDDGTQNELAYIRAHFNTLPATITKLEERGLELTSAMQLLNAETNSLSNLPGPVGRALSQKCKKIQERNPGLAVVKKICASLKGESVTVEGYTPIEIAAFKYCPLNSCEVERTFSIYKNILSDNRKRFSHENLEKYLVISCNRR